MKEIFFANESFVLDPSGLLIWPSEKLAVVSDLHLEKGSFFAEKGQLIPPHDSCKTLNMLIKALEFSAAETLIFLGDSFHDNAGYERLDSQSHKLFHYILDKYDAIWIRGNHDDAFFPDKAIIRDSWKIKDVTFRHETVLDIGGSDYEISGHYHPKASVKLKGRKVTKSCFIHTDQRLIMPSFGVYTGGLNIKEQVLQPYIGRDFLIHLLGQNNIYTFQGKN